MNDQKTKDRYTAALLIIGNEILSGRTVDANLPYLATRLNERGIQMVESRVVLDIEGMIIAATLELSGKYDYVFTSGGIGPTHDDITAAAMAKAFGTKVVKNDVAWQLLLDHYGVDQFNDARQKMAMIPDGAALIDNPVSRAPGFIIKNVYVMAGVPKIMQAMVDGFIDGLAGGTPIKSVTVNCNLPESVIAADLGKIQEKYGTDVDIGSYPFFKMGAFGTALVSRGRDDALLQSAANDIRAAIESLGGVGEIVGDAYVNMKI